MDLAARQHLGQLVADQLADAQLALGWAERLIFWIGGWSLDGSPSQSAAGLDRGQRLNEVPDHDGLTPATDTVPLKRARDGLDVEALDDVAGADVLVVGERHAALLAGRHLAAPRP